MIGFLRGEKHPTTKIKGNTLKQLKALKGDKITENKLHYYLKPNDSLEPIFYGQLKIHKEGVSIRPVISYSGSPLDNLNK